MGVNVVKEKVLVFTENLVLEEIEGTDGAFDLIVTGLELGFGVSSVSVIVPNEPEVVDADPHGAEEFA